VAIRITAQQTFVIDKALRVQPQPVIQGLLRRAPRLLPRESCSDEPERHENRSTRLIQVLPLLGFGITVTVNTHGHRAVRSDRLFLPRNTYDDAGTPVVHE
jgi:hypothetical protein